MGRGEESRENHGPVPAMRKKSPFSTMGGRVEPRKKPKERRGKMDLLILNDGWIDKTPRNPKERRGRMDRVIVTVIMILMLIPSVVCGEATVCENWSDSVRMSMKESGSVRMSMKESGPFA